MTIQAKREQRPHFYCYRNCTGSRANGSRKAERAKCKRTHNTGTKRSKKPQTLLLPRHLGVEIAEVGLIEIDTVAHCGDSMSGLFAWTVTATDILSNWTHVRFLLGYMRIDYSPAVSLMNVCWLGRIPKFRWKKNNDLLTGAEN